MCFLCLQRFHSLRKHYWVLRSLCFAAPLIFFVKTEVERQVEESKESMSMDFLQKLIQKQRSATESGAHLNLSQFGLPLFLQTTSNG